jgi:hypothetical protein
MSELNFVTLSNSELIVALSSLSEIALLRLPPRAAFRLKNTILEASRQQEAYEAIRNEIVDQYCVKNNDGSMSMIDAERGVVRMKPGYEKPMKELGEQIGGKIPVISAKMLIEAAEEAQVKLSPGVLSGLGRLLADDLE